MITAIAVDLAQLVGMSLFIVVVVVAVVVIAAVVILNFAIFELQGAQQKTVNPVLLLPVNA